MSLAFSLTLFMKPLIPVKSLLSGYLLNTRVYPVCDFEDSIMGSICNGVEVVLGRVLGL